VALLFYNERQFLEKKIELAILLIATVLILCGIGVMTISDKVDTGPTHVSQHIRKYHRRASHISLPSKELWQRSIKKVALANAAANAFASAAVAAAATAAPQKKKEMETGPPI
jgi:hypothetical protein